jgi:hypothetical protein
MELKDLRILSRLKTAGRALSIVLAGAFTGTLSIQADPLQAQQITRQAGDALAVDLVATAQSLSMRDMYARSLYEYIRTNPNSFADPTFYVNFLVYLMHQSPGFRCDRAFSNEFEKRDFFVNVQQPNLKNQIFQAISSASIPQRFDIAFTLDTQPFDFNTSSLSYHVRSIGLAENLNNTIRVRNREQSCAQQVLQSLNVATDACPWRFTVVDEAGQSAVPDFPFGRSITVPATDARVLYERFGRQLFSVVSYRFQAANNGEHKVQVFPTDGQMFGLSSDSVVRVQTFKHPQFSQPQYLDFSNEMQLIIPDLNVDMALNFQQQGFRAVGEGERQDPGTLISQGKSVQTYGSAAVGNSVFIIRLAMPSLNVDQKIQYSLGRENRGEHYVTLFGSLDYEKITAQAAPISGHAQLLQVDPSTGELKEVRLSSGFDGAFYPAGIPTAQSPAAEPQSQLDLTPIAPSAESSAVGQ